MERVSTTGSRIAGKLRDSDAYFDLFYASLGMSQNVACVVGCCRFPKVCKAGAAGQELRRPISGTRAVKNLLKGFFGLPEEEKPKDAIDLIHAAISCSFATLMLTSIGLRVARLVKPHPFLDKALGMTSKPMPYFGIFLLSRGSIHHVGLIRQGKAETKDVIQLTALVADLVGITLGLAKFSKAECALSLFAGSLTIGISLHTIKSSNSETLEDRKS